MAPGRNFWLAEAAADRVSVLLRGRRLCWSGRSTAHGYCRFRCRECDKQFNGGSAGVLNRTQDPGLFDALFFFGGLDE